VVKVANREKVETKKEVDNVKEALEFHIKELAEITDLNIKENIKEICETLKFQKYRLSNIKIVKESEKNKMNETEGEKSRINEVEGSLDMKEKTIKEINEIEGDLDEIVETIEEFSINLDEIVETIEEFSINF
ncbi:5595_t:CDS:1, partial [Dentiscutata heterogama]